MKFAFLVHPLSRDSSGFLDLDEDGSLIGSWGVDPLTLSARMHDSIKAGRARRAASEANPGVEIIDTFRDIQSTHGNSVEGRLYQIPMDALAILEESDRALAYMEEAVSQATAWGAKIVGLGSMTGIVGGRGTWLAERSSAAITTGNSLTTYAAVQNLLHAAAEFDIDLSRESIAVVGIPGSIATAAARILSAHCAEVILVARRESGPARKLANELNCDLLLDINAALQRTRLVLTATSSGNCIEQSALQPGSIVVDVGVPTDVVGGQLQRPDVMILTGGLARLPDTIPVTSRIQKLQLGHVPSCLGETILLALEERAESYSLGRVLKTDRIETLGKIARERGYGFSKLYSFGQPGSDEMLLRFRKELRKHRMDAGAISRDPATPAQLASRAKDQFARHINPVLKSLGEGSGLVRTFVRGEDVYVFDDEGNQYLDLVGGFGSLNLGHNHPDVVAAVQTALTEQAPGFAQSAINPYAAALAEELVSLAPGRLAMAFFTNSGAESNEAAIKLARAATGRSGLLYCSRSYHGKSLGSLSVTGNDSYQKPFGPLVPGCDRIPFGDYESLDRALATNNYAAFIVEPIQAEAGMLVPPTGYLREARAMCASAGTLLIVDEVQTGLGRTGTMFAVERESVEPDIMTLAKSLGGGIMPIGAMLTRQDLWTKAYGTLETFALHTSTFSGGSVASAAGLATLKTLQRGRFSDNAAEQGERLIEGLTELCGIHRCLKQVSGRGLLLGLEFEQFPAHFVSHWLAADPSGVARFMVPGYADQISAFPAFYVMQTLLNFHGMYTQLSRSNPYVMRIEPPLTITQDHVAQILNSIGEVCGEMDYAIDFMDSMIVRSTMGKHDAGEQDPNPDPSISELK